MVVNNYVRTPHKQPTEFNQRSRLVLFDDLIGFCFLSSTQSRKDCKMLKTKKKPKNFLLLSGKGISADKKKKKRKKESSR
jgi:hypothetical protein